MEELVHCSNVQYAIIQRDSLRPQRCASESCGDDGLCCIEWSLCKVRAVPHRTNGRCVHGRHSRMASFSAALGADSDQSLKLACFCTAPAIRRFGANLISEILGTLVLVLVVGAIFSKAVADSGPASGLGPYLVAVLVWGIGLSLAGTTGYAINPARDFGPRLAHAVLPVAGKGPSDWGYAVVPILG